MSSINRRNPWFAIRYKKLKSLEECGCYPWVFAAETILQFVKGGSDDYKVMHSRSASTQVPSSRSSPRSG